MEESGSVDDDLKNFRNQWRREIEESQQREESSNESSRENMARKLFLEGIELERSRKYFEAIKLYRRAVQLEPNIEYKVYQATLAENEQQKAGFSKSIAGSSGIIEHSQNANDDDEDIDDLIESFQKDLALENKPICESSFLPGTIKSGKHISALPVEVLLLILKYVVSNDLDMKSLERFGRVCKGFFLLSRDPEIWKLACYKVWKNNVSPAIESLTWREIFINRCRVLLDGCYICKISYQRLGENSFQDQFYRPVQIVEYFRLIRFFADGTLFMMTSADDLQNSVNRLKNPKIAMQSRDILRGNYHYQDNHVLIVIKKSPTNVTQKYKRKNIESDDCLTFFMELEIGNSPRRNFAKLSWKNYSVSHISNKQEISTDYDLRSSAKYPPFFFSHVKSFLTESNNCLQ
jgi:F-box protein 9